MNIQIHENNVRMFFAVDDNGRLSLHRIGVDDSEPTDCSRYRAAVELGSTPGYGSWNKKVQTDADRLRYITHRDHHADAGRRVEFDLTDGRFLVTLHYQFYDGIDTVRAWTSVKNVSDEEQLLLYVSSFHYNGIERGSCKDVKFVHNSWGQEGIVSSHTPLSLGYAELPGRGIVSSKTVVGNVGTFTTKDYLPMGYLGLDNGGMLWQIEHNGIWRCELSDNAQNLYLALAGPHEEAGWHIELVPGETYTTPTASLSLGVDFDAAMASLTAFRRVIKAMNAPMAKQPIFQNDFMHCLVTNPTDKTVREMADAAKKAGAEYYVMDAGWYADGGWWDTVGEWQESKTRFPDGLAAVFAYIREIGLTPGIWLEPEVMGVNCALAKEWQDECFWMRCGKRVANRQRHQLDYRHPTVLAHMNDTVDRLVRDYGIGFFKFDYNIDAGIGTEVDAGSVGEGFEQAQAAFKAWVDGLRARHPDVIFENCASGSMRMNYDLLSRFHLQSTSDNENYVQTAVIASNAALGVLPEQAGIWVCPLPKMTEKQLVYAIVNGFAGIPYFGGRPNELGEKFGILAEGIEVYKSFREEVKTFVPFWPLGINSYTDKRHCVAYRSGARTYVLLWQEEAVGGITLPIAARSCECIYPRKNDYRVTVGDSVTVELGDELAAGVFVLE